MNLLLKSNKLVKLYHKNCEQIKLTKQKNYKNTTQLCVKLCCTTSYGSSSAFKQIKKTISNG